jgi:type IV fimbrial biogenesis protein FimT
LKTFKTVESRRTAGFTLIELLVTMGASAILFALALPGFSTFVQNERQVAQANSLVFSLNLARSEAIKRNLNVDVCTTSNGVSCSTTSTNWSNGWIVVPEQPVAGETAALSVPALSGGNTLKASSQGTSAGVSIITFQSNGIVSLNGSTSIAPAQIAFTLCDRRGTSHAQDVELGVMGQVMTSRAPGSAVTSGVTLSCS